MTIALWIAAVIFILIGLAGLVLPALPGTPLIFCGFVIIAWIDGFHRVGLFTITILGILTIISFAIDFLAAGVGAKRAGASRMAVTGAVIGTIVGIFFGIPGLIIGPFLGAVAGEFMTRRNIAEAGIAGTATWIGLMFGIAVKIGLAFTMIGIFILAYIL